MKLLGRRGAKSLHTSFAPFLAAAGYASAHNVLATASSDEATATQLHKIAATVEAVAAAVAGPDDEEEEVDDEEEDVEPGQAAAAKSFRAWVGEVVAGLQHPQRLGDQTGGPDAGADGDGGLPLPSVLVQRVLRCLDARSAAAAARACKQMAAAYKLNTSLDLPPGFKMYCAQLASIVQGDDDPMGDGSNESEASIKWPLDGSAAAGIDVFHYMGKLALRHMLPVKVPPGLLRPVPDPEKSTPLAMFVASQPVPLYSSRSAAADADREAALDAPPTSRVQHAANSTARERVEAVINSVNAGPELSDAAAPPAPPTDIYTAGCCNVVVLDGLLSGCPMHIDGDLLSYGFRCGYKLRDPGVGGAVLRLHAGDGAVEAVKHKTYEHGLYDSVEAVCSDAGNGLVWCAADGGSRIKAFRAPKQLGGARNADAGCNAGPDNNMSLQYTLCSNTKNNWWGRTAGLHVLGTKVFAAKATGVLLSWDIAGVPVQAKERRSSRALEASDDTVGSDGEEGEIYLGDIGWRDVDDPNELEVSRGIPPQAIYRLQRPTGTHGINHTCLLNSSTSSSTTLVTSCNPAGVGDNASIVVTYDLHTQQAKNLFLGHMYEIQDLAAAPEAWAGAENLFATCARSGDVKIWDVRSTAGAAVVTLACDRQPMEAVCLAANRGSSSSSSSAAGAAGSSSSGAVAGSSSNQLGAGMLAFAGGAGECVWAWDLRNGSAQALYQLSTGNLTVESLAWHESSSSLIASCESNYENRFGECYRDDWMKVGEPDKMAQDFMMLLGAISGVNPRTEFAGLPGFEQAADSGGGEGSEGEGFEDDEWDEPKYWPRPAKHKHDDFRSYLSLSQGCVLAYTFSDGASKAVPPSQQPYFHGDW